MRKKKIKKKQKKAQEEMVGFVMIIILVAIIALVFLGISIRKPKTGFYQSEEVQNLLESVVQYTSECAISDYPEYSTVEDLVKECFYNKNCLNNQTACSVLDTELNNILDFALKPGKDSPVLGYELQVYFDNNLSKRDLIPVTEYGNCSLKKGAEHLIYPDLTIKLQVCYSQ